MFVVAHRRRGRRWRWSISLYGLPTSTRGQTPPPRYAYIGPSFDAAKDLVWGYLKHYTQAIPGIRYMEGELSVTLPNGAQIRLYGGALAYERMRGIYLDGAVLDEYPLLHPNAFTSVVRPCLADYRGFAIVSGTAAGEDHFHALKLRADDDPGWDVFDIPMTATGATARSSLTRSRRCGRTCLRTSLRREMLCSFQAPVEGAYYQEAINQLADSEPGHPGPSGPQHLGDHGVGFGHSAFAVHLVVSGMRGGSCTGSTTSRGGAKVSAITPSFSP